MLDDKVISLEACAYNDMSKYVKVFSVDQLEYHLWIYLNPEDVRGCYFVGAKEIGPNADSSTTYPDTYIRESECWIRANMGYIDKGIGKHIIKLQFVEKMTSTDFSLYVSYYIQDSNPDKPYVYMKDDGSSEPIYPWPTESEFTEYKEQETDEE